MAKYEGKDNYLNPETGVLKNILDISDEEELKTAEASLVAWRSFQLADNPLEGRFDLDHLQAIHKHLFGDVYRWAGELRNIDLAKDNSYFANHLAHNNRFFIEWEHISQDDMIQASIESFHQADNTKFAAFIYDNLRKRPASGILQKRPPTH